MEEEESLALPTLSPRLNWRRQEEEEKEELSEGERGSMRVKKQQEAEQVLAEFHPADQSNHESLLQ